MPPPTVTVCEPGDAESEKSGAAFTTNVTVVECCKLPDVPEIVTVYVPGGVEEEVVTFAVEVPDVLTVAGLKPAEAPVGNPLAPRVTVPVNPFRAPIVAV